MGIYVTIIILCHLIMFFAVVFSEPITNYLHKRKNLKWQRQCDFHREALTEEDLENMVKSFLSFQKQIAEINKDNKKNEEQAAQRMDLFAKQLSEVRKEERERLAKADCNFK